MIRAALLHTRRAFGMYRWARALGFTRRAAFLSALAGRRVPS